jgi:hypothetical protein
MAPQHMRALMPALHAHRSAVKDSAPPPLQTQVFWFSGRVSGPSKSVSYLVVEMPSKSSWHLDDRDRWVVMLQESLPMCSEALNTTSSTSLAHDCVLPGQRMWGYTFELVLKKHCSFMQNFHKEQQYHQICNDSIRFTKRHAGKCTHGMLDFQTSSASGGTWLGKRCEGKAG